MLKNIAVSLSLVLSIISLVLVTEPTRIENKIVNNSKKYVKKIESVMGGHCSSVFVKHDSKVRHITNAHCCQVPMIYGKEITGFVKIDVQNDLCELTHKFIPKDGIELSDKIAVATDVVFTVGFPGLYDLVIGQGRVIGRPVQSEHTDQKINLTSAFVIGGSSGGAVLNADGDLVGIVSQGNRMMQGAFVPLYVVKQFLNK
jgi:S1-C subfamily serine protease